MRQLNLTHGLQNALSRWKWVIWSLQIAAWLFAGFCLYLADRQDYLAYDSYVVARPDEALPLLAKTNGELTDRSRADLFGTMDFQPTGALEWIVGVAFSGPSQSEIVRMVRKQLVAPLAACLRRATEMMEAAPSPVSAGRRPLGSHHAPVLALLSQDALGQIEPASEREAALALANNGRRAWSGCPDFTTAIGDHFLPLTPAEGPAAIDFGRIRSGFDALAGRLDNLEKTLSYPAPARLDRVHHASVDLDIALARTFRTNDRGEALTTVLRDDVDRVQAARAALIAALHDARFGGIGPERLTIGELIRRYLKAVIAPALIMFVLGPLTFRSMIASASGAGPSPS